MPQGVAGGTAGQEQGNAAVLRGADRECRRVDPASRPPFEMDAAFG